MKNLIKNVVVDQTLHISNWKSGSWKSLVSKLNQENLNDAFKQHKIVKEIFKDLGDIIPRKCKLISRIVNKIEEVGARGGEYFKVASDLVAVRIHCQVKEIPLKLDMLRRIVEENNGQIYVRGEEYDRPYGYCMLKSTEKLFSDITQYIYVFIDEVGYPIEFQIGHEFATYTFTNDSRLRDDPNCGCVNLWNMNFYTMVRKYILENANNVEHILCKYDIWDTAFTLHNGSISDELRAILKRLEETS